MPKGLMIALGSPKDEDGTEMDTEQDKLDAAAELRTALAGDDDQAVVDAFEALLALME